MEEVVLADEEDTGKLLEVVGHHDVLGGTLAQAEQGVGVLDTLEGLLPQLKLDGDVELLEAGVQVSLQGVGVAQVDGVHLGLVLGGILEMVAEQLAQSSELGLSGVAKTELEGLVGGGLIHDLESGIVLEDVEDGTVRLPEELQPGGDDGSVGPVTGLLAGNGREQDGFGSLGSLEVVDVGQVVGGLGGRRNLVSLGLGLGDLLLGELDEAAENELDRGAC